MQESGDPMVQILQGMYNLLSKYGNGGQAKFVEHLISLRKAGSPAFPKELNSISIWGGAGSITDIILYSRSQDISDEEARSDNLESRKQIIALAKLMDE